MNTHTQATTHTSCELFFKKNKLKKGKDGRVGVHERVKEYVLLSYCYENGVWRATWTRERGCERCPLR